jgi:hypothetical protein
MKRITFSVILSALCILAASYFSGCKKNTTPTVGFTTTQVTLDASASPKSTVTVQLSKEVTQNVEIWLQLLGPDTLQFGSLNSRFLNDDSNRILGALSVQAVIDTPFTNYTAHLVVGYSTSSFTIDLNALFDNFAKRGVQYKLKIVKVSNATIQSGNDVLTININSQPMVPVFSSGMYLVDPNYGTSAYNLSSYSFSPNGQGSYNFDLAYTETQGSEPNTNFSINFSNLVPVVGKHSYTSDDGLGTLQTNFQVSPTPSSTRGNYYIMDTLGGFVWVKNGDTATAGITCKFVNF